MNGVNGNYDREEDAKLACSPEIVVRISMDITTGRQIHIYIYSASLKAPE